MMHNMLLSSLHRNSLERESESWDNGIQIPKTDFFVTTLSTVGNILKSL